MEDWRRDAKDYGKLDRLLQEADGSLECSDFRGANEALKGAGAKAVSMWGGVGRQAPAGMLVGLLWCVREDLKRSDEISRETLRVNLRDLRSRFDLEARRDRAEGPALRRG